MPNISVFKHKEGQAKVDYVKKLHERIKAQIEKRNESYARQANKGRKKVVFQPRDWVWVHMRKKRFPKQRKSKLQPKGNGPFQVLVRRRWLSTTVVVSRGGNRPGQARPGFKKA